MHLARTVFHCSIIELKEKISYSEFILWFAEYHRMPWGDDWEQTSMTLSTIVNMKIEKEQDHLEVDAFVPYREGTNVERRRRRLIDQYDYQAKQQKKFDQERELTKKKKRFRYFT